MNVDVLLMLALIPTYVNYNITMMLAAQFDQTTPNEILAAIMSERGDLIADV